MFTCERAYDKSEGIWEKSFLNPWTRLNEGGGWKKAGVGALHTEGVELVTVSLDVKCGFEIHSFLLSWGLDF